MSMFNHKKFLVLLVAVGLLAMTDRAHAFSMGTPDGKLDEWGVTPGAWVTEGGVRVNKSDWTPFAGIESAPLAGEDFDPTTPGGQVFPGYGGQAFDAEAMYATYDSANFYFAIVTGKNTETEYGERPGDIAFDFGNDKSYEYGIETTGADQGGAYAVSGWSHSGWEPDVVKEMASVSGALGADVPLVYNNTWYGSNASGNHYVIEGYIPISYFGADWGRPLTMSWTQTCGNDVIQLSVTPTPEPSTIVLLAIGLGGMLMFRRKLSFLA